tara:strand:+ start:1277 stop:2593 length:1317 start_codon:yes stop_codon:yes gene_type:complete
MGVYGAIRFSNRGTKVRILIRAAVFSAIVLTVIFSIFNYYFGKGFTFFDLLYSDISISWVLTLTGLIFSRLLANSYANSRRSKFEDDTERNSVLIIGGAGYIGSSLISQLLDKGYKVKVLDILLFGQDPITNYVGHKDLEIIKGDFRKVDDLVVAISGCYAVVHLGGIVGDPACSVDEALTKEINLTATKMIGQIAKSAGVRKFIFASSCSVYGAQNSILDELSETKPLSLYANTKIASEKVLEKLSDESFSPIFLRFGTVFGFSGRTRFDLVVNLLTANAFFHKKMTVFGKDQIRPFVHVNDVASSILCVLEADDIRADNYIFNIGSNGLNVTLFELAKMIKHNIPDAEIIVEDGGDDARNYHVSFDKAEKVLDFKASWSLDEGIKQVIEKLENGEISDYQSAMHSNVKHLNEQGLKVLNEKESVNWEEMLLEESYN